MFVFTQNMVQFIRKMTDEEFQEVKSKVAASLGIQTQTVEKIVEVEKVVEKEVGSTSDVELERTKAQLEVYQGLYENLMQQLVGRSA